LAYDTKAVWFDQPPVAEVALSVQTAPNAGLHAAHMGAFWDANLRDDYPLTQDQPAAPPSIESFENVSWTPTVMFGLGVPTGRQWYLSPDQTRLVQLQNDRLVLNWRRLESDDYPHYDQLRAELERVASLLSGFLEQRDLQRQPVVQAEVTYINQIPVEEPIADLSDIGALLGPLRPSWPGDIGTPETMQFEQRFRLDGPAGKPARLYVAVAPGVLADGRSYLSLNLVVRGAPAGQTTLDALEWMDFGHNQIINTFADITTETMRRKWRQQDASRRDP
jgi:uncharacterized protein (TIGR04255 family)